MESLAILLVPVLAVAIFPSRWLAVVVAVGALAILLYKMSLGFVFPSPSRIDAWVVLVVMVVGFLALYGASLLGVIHVRRRLFPSAGVPQTTQSDAPLRANPQRTTAPSVLSSMSAAITLRRFSWRRGFFRLWLVLACIWWIGAGAVLVRDLPSVPYRQSMEYFLSTRCSDVYFEPDLSACVVRDANTSDMSSVLRDAADHIRCINEQTARQRAAAVRNCETGVRLEWPALAEQMYRRQMREWLEGLLLACGAIVAAPFAFWLMVTLAIGVGLWIVAGFKKPFSPEK